MVNKSKLIFADLLVLMLIMLSMMLNAPAVSAAGTCTVTVDLPDGLAAAGAKVSIYPWNSSYTDGQSFVKNQGENVTWRLIVGPFTGNSFNYKVPASDTAILTVGPDAYCEMKVINVPAGGKIKYYPWNNSWVNDQVVFLPIGASITWLLNVNGFDGQQYKKNVDCTPLDANGSACNMLVTGVPTGQKVNVYPWNTYWTDGQNIIVPIGGSCVWKLVGPGASGTQYTKKFDCTPLVIASPNQPPVANNQSVGTNEDTPVMITLSATDPDGDPLTYSVVTPPVNGSLSGMPPNLTYTPVANYNGSDSFTFKANDGQADSNAATVSITINSVNDAPVANDQSVTTSEDNAKAITLTTTDVDGDSLTYSVVDSPTHGTLTGTPPDVTYTPTSDYSGPDSFTFKANDGIADSNVATVSINVLDTTPPVTTATVSPSANANGWNNSDVTVTLSATDIGGSGVASTEYDLDGGGWTTYTAPIIISTEGTHTILYRSTDNAGNVETDNTLTVKLDKTAPTVSASQDPLPNANGWNNSDVTVTLTATDNAGGADVKEIHYSIDGTPAVVSGASTSSALSADGQHTVTYYAVDNAGNSGTPGTMTANIDMMLPVVAITAPLDGHYYQSTALPTGAYTVTDANSCTVLQQGYSTDEGPHTYIVTATDIAGNVASASVYYTVDNTAPKVTINAPVNGSTYFSTSVPTADYTIDDIDTSPAVMIDGWSNSPGIRTVTVTATDAAGNVGKATSTYTVVPPDTDAPTVSASQDPSPNANGWNNSDVTVTLTATDNVGGSGVKGIHYSINSGSEQAVSGGTTAFTLSAEGSHTISYYAVDNDGNSGNGNPGTMTVNIDKTLPVITINSPSNGGVYQSENLPPEDIKVTDNLDTSPAVDAIGDGSDEGLHTMTVAATDAAGNVGTASITYIVDNTPPLVSINAPADGGIYKPVNMPAPDYTVTDLLDPNPVIVVTGYSTAEGVHTMTVTATDAAGNVGTDSVTYTVKGKPPAWVDKTPPIIIIKSPRAKDYYAWELLKVHVNVQDHQSGVASYSATLDGNPVNNGQTIDLNNMMAGSHTFGVIATDKAGNVANKSVKFNVVNGIIKARIHIVPGVINLKSQSDKNAVTAIIDLPRGRGENQIDVSTVKLNINGTLISAQLPGPKEKFFAFMVKFDRQQVIGALNGLNGKVAVTVTGALKNGAQFTGKDTITVINQGNKH